MLDTNQHLILFKFIDKLRIDRKQTPSTFVIKLLKDKKRVQKLLQSSIIRDELPEYLDSDIQPLIDNKLIKDVGGKKYVLTIKGMLMTLSYLQDNNSDSKIYEVFLEELFDSEFQTKSITKPLTSYEKIWLLSMIILNCFSEATGIDVHFNSVNKDICIQLFNNVGSFLKENGYEIGFKPIEKNADEIFRREIENINKKFYNIEFGKKRGNFFIDLSKSQDKETVLINIFNKIFYIDGKRFTLTDIQKIRDLIRECQPFFFKVKRKMQNIDIVQPDLIVDSALKKLV